MQSPPVLNRQRLTGRIRGRRQFITGKVVLQVEVQLQGARAFAYIPPPPPPGIDPADWAELESERQEGVWTTLKTFWRDATHAELAPTLPLPQHDRIETIGGYQPVAARRTHKPPPKKP